MLKVVKQVAEQAAGKVSRMAYRLQYSDPDKLNPAYLDRIANWREYGVTRGDMYIYQSDQVGWAMEMMKLEQPEEFQKMYRRLHRLDRQAYEGTNFHQEPEKLDGLNIEYDILQPYMERYDRIYNEKKRRNINKYPQTLCYGSLVNTISRHKTVKSHGAFPVTLNGYHRKWSYPVKTVTALGVQKSPDHKANGVIFAMDPAYLIDLRRREFNYTITEIPFSNFVPYEEGGDFRDEFQLGIDEDPDVIVFTYSPKESELKRVNKVDVDYIKMVLDGFRNVSDDFVDQFVAQTDKVKVEDVVGELGEYDFDGIIV